MIEKLKKLEILRDKKTILLYIIFSIGLIILIREYIGGRSLWVDEAMLALNIKKSFGELLLTLENHQAAPILFLYLSKIFTIIFGLSDYSLRITPLLSGIGSLILFLITIKKIFDPNGRILALSLFIVTDRLIYYINEFKQYSTEVFFAVLFFYFLVILNEKSKISLKIILIIGFTGIISVWFSFSAIIVILAFIPLLLYRVIKQKQLSIITSSSTFSAIWILNIAVEYFLIYQKNPNFKFQPLLEYWTGSFMPFPPKSLGDILWIPKNLKDFFIYMTNSNFLFAREYPLIKEIFAYVFMGLFLYGIVYVLKFKKNQTYAVLFTIFLFTVSIAASAVKKYPFGDRLALFMIPAVLIICTYGLTELIRQMSKANKIIPVIFLILIFFLPVLPRIYHLAEPTYKSEIKSVINYYKSNRKTGDKIFVKNHQVYYLPQWEFYADKPFDFTDLEADYTTVKTAEDLQQELYGNSRVWAIGDMGPAKNKYKLLETFKPITLASRWPFNFLKKKIEYLNHPNAVIYLYDCQYTNLERLIMRFYTNGLGRLPETEELKNWADSLKTGEKKIADAAWFFLHNEYFLENIKSDESFIKAAYLILLDRDPDEAGLHYWMEQLKDNQDRDYIINGLMNSDEFKNTGIKNYELPQ